jgi:hypothetical protein
LPSVPTSEWSPVAAPPAARVSTAGELEAAARETARILASYGWATFALRPPEPERAESRGLRLGRWRVQPWVLPSGLPGFRGLFEERRDPERAEAHLALGLALEGQGAQEKALDAYAWALHHFADDPRTGSRQAFALTRIGALLRALGRQPEARLAFARAVALDPSLAPRYPEVAAGLLDPSPPLAALADDTAGRLVADGPLLEAAIGSLSRRVRLTYQVEGPPSGGLLPVEVRPRRPGIRLRAPRWARWGSPETLAELRVRRVLAGDLPGGALPVHAELAPAGDDGEGPARLAVRIDPDSALREPASEEPAWIRLTLGSGGPGVTATVRHERLPPRQLAGFSWETDLPGAAPGPWIAVLVEDLATGAWGADVVELDR